VADPTRSADQPPRLRHDLTPGFVDGFGERLLTFDSLSRTSLELLRFGPEFSASSSFEQALRQRVEAVKSVQHPSLSSVRKVDWMDGQSGLVLVSTHTAGRRLAELLPRTFSPAFVPELIRAVVSALAALQHSGSDFCHGALTVDRIVVTRDGRVVVVEHVLGSALASMDLPTSVLRTRIGLALPGVGSEPVNLGGRNDVVQVGFIAMQILLGRRLDPADYPGKIVGLLDQSAQTEAGATWGASRLRSWVERALQLDMARPLKSVQMAYDALGELPSEGQLQPAGARQMVQVDGPATSAAPVESRTAESRTAESRTIESGATELRTTESRTTAVQSPAKTTATATGQVGKETGSSAGSDRHPGAGGPAVRAPQPVPAPQAAQAVAPAAPNRGAGARPRKTFSPATWIATGLGVLSVFQFVVIAAMYSDRSQRFIVEVPQPQAARGPSAAGTDASVAGRVPPGPTLQVAPAAAAAPAVLPTATASPSQTAETNAADRGTRADHFGGVTVSAPFELQVFEGGRAVGSTVGPIATADGPHTFDLVNEGLGYRSRQTVNVRAGQMTSVTISVPNGHMSVNAAPWADVWIDGNPVGQTPLANLSMPIGSHEIVFRHPQLAEQRQTAVVKADGITRVSVNLQR
jgi:hypothetical protein